MTKKRDGSEIPPAAFPAHWELADLSAVQAVYAGTASAEQQKRALKWIIVDVCDNDGLGWHPNSPHEASFCAGRRFAGLQIVKALKLNVSALRRVENA